jgi:hypothetical protein
MASVCAYTAGADGVLAGEGVTLEKHHAQPTLAEPGGQGGAGRPTADHTDVERRGRHQDLPSPLVSSCPLPNAGQGTRPVIGHGGPNGFCQLAILAQKIDFLGWTGIILKSQERIWRAVTMTG